MKNSGRPTQGKVNADFHSSLMAVQSMPDISSVYKNVPIQCLQSTKKVMSTGFPMTCDILLKLFHFLAVLA